VKTRRNRRTKGERGDKINRSTSRSLTYSPHVAMWSKNGMTVVEYAVDGSNRHHGGVGQVGRKFRYESNGREQADLAMIQQTNHGPCLNEVVKVTRYR
jgi:hypothetical protein